MSARKATIGARKRKPYKKPAIKLLTLQRAKKILETQSELANQNSKKLLEEINRRLERDE